MTTERSAADPAARTAADPAEPETMTTVAGRRRWWPWVTLLVVVALAVAATTVWLMTGPRSKSPAAAAPDDLKSAQLALINAPGVHYTGNLSGSDGKAPRLEVRVTNAGVAYGTIDYGSGKTLTYLAVGGKAFLGGGSDAWIAHGVTPEIARSNADYPVLLPGGKVLSVDIAVQLKPEALARRLGPIPGRSELMTRGAATFIDGQTVDGLTSGSLTTYLVSGRARRITDPTFDVTPTPMTADEVARLYREVRPAVTALDYAGDTGSTVTVALSWISNPCAPICTSIADVTSTPKPPVAVNVPGATPPVDDIFVAYDTVLTSGDAVTPHPECSGVMQMPGRGTTRLTCGLFISGGQPANVVVTLRPVLGPARADVLVGALDAAAKESEDRAKCTVTSLSETATPHC
ncbi:hypothetical protein ACFYUD_35070 [Nocardia tengchongensis]|uniref:hypothetical protein n=1 Tax=Nocardia tengchongensis TaxID=2055889 RepID=UPI0036AEE5D1